MARPRREEDETSGGWWKAGLAAAGAVAVGAGILWGATKLLENEEKEKPYQLGQYTARPAPPIQSRYDHGDSFRSEASSRLSSVSCGSQVALDGSLRQRLEHYYREHVEIPEMEVEKAQAVVADIKNEYLEHIRMNLPEFNVKMVDSGSSAEGLKVIAPDEFDVMLVVESQNLPGCENPRIKPGRLELPDAGGFYHIKFLEFQAESARSSWPNMPKWIENGYLSPVRARSAFQSLSTQVFNDYDSYDVTAATIGPAVTFRVRYQINPPKFLSIDFVPAYKFGSDIFVAKPHPEVQRTNGQCADEYKYLWRRSYSSHEKKLVGRIDEGIGCHLKCLKLLKAVQVDHRPELGMFSSYVLKTLLFHMYQDDPCWRDEELDERFVQMLRKLQEHLEKRKLRHFFQTDINILEHVSRAKCDQAVNYLTRTLDKQRWNNLLQTRL